MSSGKFAPQLVMYEDFYKNKDISSVTELSRALQNEAPWLSTYVTHLAFSSSSFGRKNFPLLAATEGRVEGGKASKTNITQVSLKNAADEYKVPVMGKPQKTSTVVSTVYTSDSDRAGVSGTTFKLIFADRHFSRTQIVYPPHYNAALQCMVMEDPKAVATGWEYVLQIVTKSSTLYMPFVCLRKGSQWSAGGFKVGFEDSRGVESRSYLPGAVTNMLTYTRSTYKFKGNTGGKIMMFKIPVDGKVFESYMDWEIYLANMAHRERCESDLWWSQYGKSTTGEAMLIDSETGVPITSGAGIDQQIPPANSDTYSILTYNKFFNIVREITFNIVDAMPNIIMWTGTGGMEDFDRMLKNELSGFTQFIPSTQFTTGQAPSYELTYGAFFKSFRHVDGYTVTVMHHPMFDNGIRAQGMPLNPTSGLPLCSHDFYFLDMSVYDGRGNVQFVSQEGRQYTTFERGSTPPTSLPMGYPTGDGSVSTDRDRSAIHTFGTHGVQIMRPTSCFKLNCRAGF